MIGLALLAPLSSFAEENGANKKKPNIIYILADDLGIYGGMTKWLHVEMFGIIKLY